MKVKVQCHCRDCGAALFAEIYGGRMPEQSDPLIVRVEPCEGCKSSTAERANAAGYDYGHAVGRNDGILDYKRQRREKRAAKRRAITIDQEVARKRWEDSTRNSTRNRILAASDAEKQRVERVGGCR